MNILGTANPADLMTKYLTREKVDNAIDKMGQVVQHGRAKSSLDIQGTIKKVQGVERRQQSSTIGGGARASPLEQDCCETTGEGVVRIHSQPRSALFAVTAKDAEYESRGR